MNVFRLTTLMLFSVVLSACAQTPATADFVATDKNTSRTSLDWTGRYQGILPCDNCPGIATEIQLHPLSADQTSGQAILTQSYLESGRTPTITKATYSWYDNGRDLIIESPGHNPILLQVGENQLLWLNDKGEKITGDLAGHYLLNKIQGFERLTGALLPIQWQVTQLNEQPVENSNSNPFPHLQFFDDLAVRGFAGCNQFGGDLFVNGNQLDIGALMSTRRACFAATIEPQLLAAMDKVYRYRLSDADTLLLFNAKGSLLITLKAIRVESL